LLYNKVSIIKGLTLPRTLEVRFCEYGEIGIIKKIILDLYDTKFLQQALQPIFDQLENKENKLSPSVFLNPNNINDKFSVEFVGITDSNQKIKLSIYDIEGTSVFRSDIITKEEIRVLIQPENGLFSGTYIVESDLKVIKLCKKFVVQ
jgi:hypothetical protein